MITQLASTDYQNIVTLWNKNEGIYKSLIGENKVSTRSCFTN